MHNQPPLTEAIVIEEKVLARWNEDPAAARDWIAGEMSAKRPFLLAHLDDGIVWGKWQEGQLLTSHKVAQKAQVTMDISPPLRGLTLQQAFIFGPDDEVRLFRDELGQWQACLIADRESDSFTESQLLIGDRICHRFDDFTHLQDRAQQGLDQIVPIRFPETWQQQADNQGNDDIDRPRLLVKHYIEEDRETGEARIQLSRLVCVYLANNQGKEAPV